MSYAKQIIDIASAIGEEAGVLASLEKERSEWVRPERNYFSVGRTRYYVVRKDGTVTPGLEGIQREALKLHDDQIFKSRSRLEGLRFKLANLGKLTHEGGTA